MLIGMIAAHTRVYPSAVGEDAAAAEHASRLIETTIGMMIATAIGGRLTRLGFTPDDTPPGAIEAHNGADADACATLDLIESELGAYFSALGAAMVFTTPLGLAGTPFQIAVWTELLRIPPGQTRSYGEIARAIGTPGAVRAVGSANGANPIAVVVPCHRVIRSDGARGGYAGGTRRKDWLLNHEHNNELFI